MNSQRFGCGLWRSSTSAAPPAAMFAWGISIGEMSLHYVARNAFHGIVLMFRCFWASSWQERGTPPWRTSTKKGAGRGLGTARGILRCWPVAAAQWAASRPHFRCQVWKICCFRSLVYPAQGTDTAMESQHPALKLQIILVGRLRAKHHQENTLIMRLSLIHAASCLPGGLLLGRLGPVVGAAGRAAAAMSAPKGSTPDNSCVQTQPRILFSILRATVATIFIETRAGSRIVIT